ncbi:MAG: hypothetical protein Ta2F_16120 [Termitinemataceae bacterium]|nr:MAG: hypothetical protein Ta2F_16120 [Termitinemataceae bacterium]
MSYTQRYQDSITVSGSKTVSYPKSENGGSHTVHYSETVPLDITINVLTEPFDNSVDNTNRSIDILTGAVVAMNASQCAAIEQTAKEVSTHIIDGFFGTIKTELSQQIQALDSAIKAGFGLIAEQGKAVNAQKSVMEGDYNRISSRYVTLFNDLDKECYKRIHALDEQSFNLSEKVQRALLSQTAGNDAAKNLLIILEESTSKAMIAVSTMNRKTSEILNTLHDYITQETRIANLINSFLYDNAVKNNNDLFISIIFSQSSDINAQSNIENCAIPEFITDTGRSAISKQAISFSSNISNNNWCAIHENEKELINREFNSLCESYFSQSNDVQNRVYKTMIELWQKSNLQTLKSTVTNRTSI